MRNSAGISIVVLLIFMFNFFTVSDFFLLRGNDSSQIKKVKKKHVIVKKIEEQESRVIPLHTVNYSTIEAICKPMLSNSGTMGYIEERNSIILFDFKDKIEKISKLINKIDLPPVNIRITVDFFSNSSGRKDSLYGKVGYKKNKTIKNLAASNGKLKKQFRELQLNSLGGLNNQIIIRNGKIIKPNRITLGGGISTQTTTRNTTQFIMTKSGYPARLWVGKTIVDPSWLQYCQLRPTYIISRRGGVVVVPGYDNDIVWSDIGSELYVKPIYLGNGKIDLEVYPVVTYLVDDPIESTSGKKRKKGRRKKRRKRQSVMVQNISTHLILQSGKRVSMGGVIGSNKKFYRNLFGPDFLSRDNSNSILDMYITATVVDSFGIKRINRK